MCVEEQHKKQHKNWQKCASKCKERNEEIKHPYTCSKFPCIRNTNNEKENENRMMTIIFIQFSPFSPFFHPSLILLILSNFFYKNALLMFFAFYYYFQSSIFIDIFFYFFSPSEFLISFVQFFFLCTHPHTSINNLSFMQILR